MQAGLVSVVIPVYKTEKYLDRCINSVVNQTYRNLEILLIDDGSPDNCPQMCDAWAEKDSRIRVIHKENQGLGMARNTGIENATGEYICFFDSDDYVDAKTVEYAFNAAQKEKADVAIFGLTTVSAKGEVKQSWIPNPSSTIYRGQAVRDDFLPDLIGADPKTGKKSNLWMSACSCLFSTSMLRKSGWRFCSERDIISEDVYSLLGLYRYVDAVVVLKQAPYYYCENQASLTRSYQPGRYQRIKYFYQECMELCCKNDYLQEVMIRCAEPFLSFTISALKQEAARMDNKADAYRQIRKIVDDDVLQSVLKKKKKEKLGIKQTILFWAMRRKRYALCCFLLQARNKLERIM